ncbi:hypothetical protein GCM10010357_16760 [Streptomyces luteireticuli]|uniref:Uncharacterized protein n=1 Tax=Streptomyces luteireticuli TaxID=173858 RepID=A0ABN0YI41_9ACTN
MLRRLCTARETKLQLAASVARSLLTAKESKITLKVGFRPSKAGKARRSGGNGPDPARGDRERRG